MCWYDAARFLFGRRLLGWVFSYMSFTLPVNRLLETPKIVAFYHPRPSYPVHILLVPKKSIASLSELQESDMDFMNDLFSCVQSLVMALDLEQEGYRLIVNGGKYQEIPQLHFHLISGGEMETINK